MHLATTNALPQATNQTMPAISPFMERAIKLAKRGQGLVEPNPMVGAVIVKDDKIIGEGFHGAFGKAHGEIAALSDCKNKGNNPKGATIYVTLEPCSHTGKTPPCANALIESGIKKVIAAMEDPFKKVAGRGFAKLRAANIEVEIGDGQKEAQILNEPFIKRIKTDLPWVILKWAQTLDGKIATATGESRWISNQKSRKIVHQLRSRVDAILIGANTARYDNPSLTARLENEKPKRLARRVIIDSTLTIAPNLSIVKNFDPSTCAPITIATRKNNLSDNSAVDNLKRLGIEIIDLPEIDSGEVNRDNCPPNNHLDLKPLMVHLSKNHSATNVLVEGGGKLFGSLLKQQLANQILAFVAPTILGDSAGKNAIDGFNINQIFRAQKLHLENITQIENGDILLDYRLRY